MLFLTGSEDYVAHVFFFEEYDVKHHCNFFLPEISEDIIDLAMSQTDFAYDFAIWSSVLLRKHSDILVEDSDIEQEIRKFAHIVSFDENHQCAYNSIKEIRFDKQKITLDEIISRNFPGKTFFAEVPVITQEYSVSYN